MNKIAYIKKIVREAKIHDLKFNFRKSDLLTSYLVKLAQNEPFELSEGLTYNDPKDVMGYFLGFAQDMVQRDPKISKKRLLLEVEKKINEKISEMSEEDKKEYSSLFDDVVLELENQSYWDDLPEDLETTITFDSNSTGFENAFNYILDVEGGFTDYDYMTGDPTTNLGITQSRYDEYRNSKGLEEQSVKFITKDEAEEIYYSSYWSPMNGDEIYAELPKTAITIFDFYVNSGRNGALQVLRNTIPHDPSKPINFDSGIDNIISFGLSIGDDELSKNLIYQRSAWYENLIERKPAFEKYRKGWGNRLDKLTNLVDQVNVV